VKPASVKISHATKPAEHTDVLKQLLSHLDAHHDDPKDISSLEKLRTVLNHWAHKHGHPAAHHASNPLHYTHTTTGNHQLPTVNTRQEDTDPSQYYQHIHHTSDGYRGSRSHSPDSQASWQAHTNPNVRDRFSSARYVEKTQKIPVFTDSAAAFVHGYKNPCAPVHPYYPHCDCNPTSKGWPSCTEHFVPNNEVKEVEPGIPQTAKEHSVQSYTVDPLTNQPILVHKTAASTTHTHEHGHIHPTKPVLPHIPLQDMLHSDQIPAPLLHQAAVAAAAGQQNPGYVVVVDDDN